MIFFGVDWKCSSEYLLSLFGVTCFSQKRPAKCGPRQAYKPLFQKSLVNLCFEPTKMLFKQPLCQNQSTQLTSKFKVYSKNRKQGCQVTYRNLFNRIVKSKCRKMYEAWGYLVQVCCYPFCVKDGLKESLALLRFLQSTASRTRIMHYAPTNELAKGPKQHQGIRRQDDVYGHSKWVCIG